MDTSEHPRTPSSHRPHLATCSSRLHPSPPSNNFLQYPLLSPSITSLQHFSHHFPQHPLPLTPSVTSLHHLCHICLSLPFTNSVHHLSLSHFSITFLLHLPVTSPCQLPSSISCHLTPSPPSITSACYLPLSLLLLPSVTSLITSLHHFPKICHCIRCEGLPTVTPSLGPHVLMFPQSVRDRFSL